MGGSHDTRPRHDRLLHQLAAGFDALYNKVEELLATNVQLERQIKEVQPQSQVRTLGSRTLTYYMTISLSSRSRAVMQR